MISSIIGLTAAALTSLAFIPQIIKLFKTKSVMDLSPITLGQFTFGVLLWLVYGFLRHDFVIILANLATLLTLILLWYLCLKFTKGIKWE